MAKIHAWHGKTLAQHKALRDKWSPSGYRFLSLSLYGTVSAPRYAAVMIKRSTVVAQRSWPFLTATQFQKKFDEQAKKGFGPVILTATGSASNPRFAVVFQKKKPIPLTRFGLKSGDASDESTLQGMNRKAKKKNLILQWAAAYGTASSPRYAAVWTPNKNKTIWNGNAIADTSAEYQERFGAHVSAWRRPGFVTISPAKRYFSLFVDNDIGPWIARHNMTSAKYQQEFDKWRAKGYFPLYVQGGGSGSSTRYTVLFVKRENETPKEFTATGPVAKPDIDAVLAKIMKDTPVRHASLAIVKGTRLVYARGYTWGEPDWPLAQPTTHFRIASVAKLITSLAIYQLIEEKKLSLSTKLQDVLKLKTPSGGAPKDKRFKNITIRHLLEHTSGLNSSAYGKDLAIRDAHKAAQPSSNWNLPVSAAMTDSYVASQNLVIGASEKPGDVQTYNNTAYNLLGRVVAKLRGTKTPMDAYLAYLLDPLDAMRIRSGRSLLSQQFSNEARYGISREKLDEDVYALNIDVNKSVMSNSEPLVARGYGHAQMEKIDGSGGLSAATTDLARILALLISQNNTPALKRSTVVNMLNNGIKAKAKYGSRAGHGLDGAKSLANNKYYGQKGGSLATSGNVVQFNGDWAFAMCWAGKEIAKYQGASWYPNFDAVMSIAKGINWGSSDLFPQYGMPAL